MKLWRHTIAALLAAAPALAQTSITVTAPDRDSAMAILNGRTAKDAMAVPGGTSGAISTTAPPATTTAPPATTTGSATTTTTPPVISGTPSGTTTGATNTGASPATTPPTTTPTTTPAAAAETCPEGLHAEKIVFQGHTWTLSGYKALMDGQPTSGGGSSLMCWQYQVHAKGIDGTWYVSNGSVWLQDGADPSAGATWPLIGVATTSPNGTHGVTITDSYGRKWTFSGFNAMIDGVASGGGGSLFLLWNNQVYTRGIDNTWYIWNGSMWLGVGAQDPSTVSPAPKFAPAVVPPAPAFTGGATTTGSATPPATTTPPAAVAVPGPTVPFGSTGKQVAVAADGDLMAAVKGAQPGDTIVVAAGVFKTPLDVPDGIWIKGAWAGTADNPAPGSGTVLDCTGIASGNLANKGFGCLATHGSARIEGFEIIGTGMQEGASGGTAGVRPATDGTIELVSDYFHDNQDGIAAGVFKTAWSIKDSLFENNGLPDGLSHNIYLSTGTQSVTFDGVTSRTPKFAHAVKLRVLKVTVNNSYFDGGNNGAALDAQDGGDITITNSVIGKPAGAPNHHLIRYGEGSANLGLPGVKMTGGEIRALCDSPQLDTAGPMTLSGVKLTGNPISVQGGGTVTGLQ